MKYIKVLAVAIVAMFAFEGAKAQVAVTAHIGAPVRTRTVVVNRPVYHRTYHRRTVVVHRPAYRRPVYRRHVVVNRPIHHRPYNRRVVVVRHH